MKCDRRQGSAQCSLLSGTFDSAILRGPVSFEPGLKRRAPPQLARAVQWQFDLIGVWSILCASHEPEKSQRTMNNFPALMKRNWTPLLRYYFEVASSHVAGKRRDVDASLFSGKGA